MHPDIKEAFSKFPATFGLRGYPGDLFRCSEQSSYINDYGKVTIYTERQAKDGTWQAFAKGSVAELLREVV